eukprot:6212524-Pleurochrysis_carterae.AAC.2
MRLRPSRAARVPLCVAAPTALADAAWTAPTPASCDDGIQSTTYTTYGFECPMFGTLLRYHRAKRWPASTASIV